MKIARFTVSAIILAFLGWMIIQPLMLVLMLALLLCITFPAIPAIALVLTLAGLYVSHVGELPNPFCDCADVHHRATEHRRLFGDTR